MLRSNKCVYCIRNAGNRYLFLLIYIKKSFETCKLHDWNRLFMQIAYLILFLYALKYYDYFIKDVVLHDFCNQNMSLD